MLQNKQSDSCIVSTHYREYFKKDHKQSKKYIFENLNQYIMMMILTKVNEIMLKKHDSGTQNILKKCH